MVREKAHAAAGGSLTARLFEDIGKESDGWEADEAQSKDEATVLTDPASSFDSRRLLDAIETREAGIAMRTACADQDVADEGFRRIAGAAERIATWRTAREEKVAEALVWLKTNRGEIGLAALAKMLGAAGASLWKVIEQKRRPSRALLIKIAFLREQRV